MNCAAAVSVPVLYGGSFSFVPREYTGLDDFEYLSSVREALRGFQGDGDEFTPLLIEFHFFDKLNGGRAGYVGGNIEEQLDGSFSRRIVETGRSFFDENIDREIALMDEDRANYHHVTIILPKQCAIL